MTPADQSDSLWDSRWETCARDRLPSPNAGAPMQPHPDEATLGLMAYAKDRAAYQAALDRLTPKPARLAAVPMPVSEQDTPSRGEQADHQPWMPRPARRRAA